MDPHRAPLNVTNAYGFGDHSPGFHQPNFKIVVEIGSWGEVSQRYSIYN